MKDYWKGFAVGIACTALAVGAGATGIYHGSHRGLMEDSDVTGKISTLESLIDEYYLNETDKTKLADGLYHGLLTSLGDPYSCYYTEKEYDQEYLESEGNYVGIGISMEEAPEGARIAEVYPNSPAETAGLQEGDLLIAMDGESLEGKALIDISAMVKKEDGAEQPMTILRDGVEQEVTVVLGEVEIPFVNYTLLDNQVGYLQLTEFTTIALEQYKSAMEDLREQGMQSLVVDLRDNPGGYLDTVCDILRQILPEGRIMYTEDKYGNQEEETCDGRHQLEMPLAVLVNGDSASASEVFAGAVQDYGVGIIVGTTTFGKGIVQSVQPLTDGSAVKLTIAHYYTPNGNDIHKKGITPDVEVEMEEDFTEVSFEDDVQLQKALEALADKQTTTEEKS